MARPRLVSDDAILDATRRVLAETGPAQLTLAAVGERAGLAAPTLMQRFGSKRGLLLAAATRSAQQVLPAADEAASRHASPLAALRTFLLAAAAHQLVDLGNDPEVRRQAQSRSDAVLAACERFYRAALTSGELRPATDVQALARQTLVSWTGALAVTGLGPPRALIAEQLSALLAPHR
jgi:AcrR family transcriptional regulator